MILVQLIPIIKNSPAFITDFEKNGPIEDMCVSEYHFFSHMNFVIIVFYLIAIQKLKVPQKTIICLTILVISLLVYSINRAQAKVLVIN